MAIDLTGHFFNIIQEKISKGQNLNLDFSVLNNGDEYVEPFSFDIVISRDDEISEDDYKLGNYVIRDGLQAGENSGLKSYRYSTPDANNPFWLDEEHSYTVGIRLDPDNEYFETDENNNSNQEIGVDFDRVNVGEFAPSDLSASLARVSNEEITPGEKVDVSFVIENESREAANPFSIDIYISSDDHIDPEEDFKLGTYDIRDVVPAGGDTGVKNYSYPTPDLGHPIWAEGDGEYYVGFDIDPKNEVPEVDESDNSNQGEGLDYAGFEVTELDSAPDLVGSSFNAPENFKAGDTITVEYEITNEGGSAADYFAGGFYLFTEDYLADNHSLSIEDVPEVYFLQGDEDSALIKLDPGESTGKMTTELTIPEEWAGFSGKGNYYLGLEADPYHDVAESNDANNSLTEEKVDYQKVTIDAPENNTVDLVGTHFEVVQDQILPGHEFDLGFTVKNEGLAKVDSFYFDLYLSADEDISADEDVYLGRYDVRDGLDGKSDIGLKSIRYTAPEADAEIWADGEGDGTYYAGMIIDPANDIHETNEENNSNQKEGLDYSATHVTGLGSIADLKTNGNFDVMPDEITTGETFEVKYDIFNEGTEAAHGFAAGFYIFTEDYLNNNDVLDIDDVPHVYFMQGDRDSSLIDLDPGTGTGVVSTELTMPTDWDGFAGGSGEYYIGVAADPYHDIVESDEFNNSLNGEFIDYEKVIINLGEEI